MGDPIRDLPPQQHLEECSVDRCDLCDYYLERWQSCEGCGHWMHMSVGWPHCQLIDGQPFCEQCAVEKCGGTDQPY